MSKTKKYLQRGGFGLLILVILLGGGGGYYFKSYLPNTIAPKSFPQIDGEVQLDGLDGPVDIYRDKMGIPHIYASTEHDLFFAQGYVHAQERFWQMDFWRHVGSGRISEMFNSQVDTDKFLRTLGWRQTAEQEYTQLDDKSKAILDSYTAGVNAYLKDHKKETLSLEYSVLSLLNSGYAIEPWTPINSLTWGKAMAWDLRGNMGEEIERAVLLKTLTPEQVAELFPPYPQDHPVIVNKIGDGSTASSAITPTLAVDIPNATLTALQQNASLLDSALGPTGDGIGSNSWAVSGKLTTTGKPLLANDPHLSIQMPSIWYQMHLECRPISDACSFNVAGFTFAGVPGVIIGHNDHMAWGFTNVGPDVMDLYIEKINPKNPNQYEVNGKWVDFETRKEVIKVAGKDPVEMTVRISRHGPIISDTYGPVEDVGDPKDKKFVPFKDRAGVDLPQEYAIALKWTALVPSTPFDAIWGFDRAQNWDDFRAAAKKFHVPAQNLLYADADGNIGYQMPGDIPIRARGDGTLPVPGWTDEYEWTGYVPFDQLPYTFNPAEGYIVTANNQVPPAGYPNFITYDWDYGFRAQRITDLINNAQGKIDIPYIESIQGDDFDANGPVYIPKLLELGGLSGNQAKAQALLNDWDYQAKAGSAAAAVFEAFWRHLLQNTFNDDMPEERYYPDGGSRWDEIMRHISPDSAWWDDKTTKDVVETENDIIKKSFADAVSELVSMFGKDPAKWNWGDMHAAIFRNGTLGASASPSFIRDLFNRGPYPTNGGEAIVNATGWSVKDGYETNWLPSMRMIVDFSNLNNSVTVHTTGQSGHAYHPHYDDMAPLWANIKYYPMWWNLDSIQADSEGHLVLSPK